MREMVLLLVTTQVLEMDLQYIVALRCKHESRTIAQKDLFLQEVILFIFVQHYQVQTISSQ